MDNGDKIEVMQNDEVETDRKAEVRLFLHDELIPLQKSSEVHSYNLVNEYAKTKKNKSSFIWILLGVCFAVVASVTVFSMIYLSKQNKKISVDSKVFSDLDMHSMLDTQSHAEMNYLVAENTCNRLETERDFKLKQAVIERDANLSLTEALRADNGDKQKAGIISEYKRLAALIHGEYDDKIKIAADEAAQYKMQFDLKKAASLETADFSRQVQQHERTLLVDTYAKTIKDLQQQMAAYQLSEAALNTAAVSKLADAYHAEVDSLDPVLNDNRADVILKRTAGMPSKPDDVPSYLASFPENVLTDDFMERMAEVQNLFSDYQYLHNAMSGIPQKHSIAGYKTSETRLVNQIGTEFGKAVSSQITGMYAEIQRLESENSGLKNERDSLIRSREDMQAEYDKLEGEYTGVSGNVSMYNSWFEKMAAEEKSAGYILDVSDPSAMKAFIVQSVRAELFSKKKDIQVIVYHGKLRKVTTGTVSVQSGVCCFVPSDSAAVSKITAGDRLVPESQ
jgi:hypothetical protein